MNTVIKDWVIVSVIDDGLLVGKVLWGIVIDDMSCRFFKGDYVCSSEIVNIHSYKQLIKLVAVACIKSLEMVTEQKLNLKNLSCCGMASTLSKLKSFVNRHTSKFTDA